jgi:hypothetical protein
MRLIPCAGLLLTLALLALACSDDDMGSPADSGGALDKSAPCYAACVAKGSSDLSGTLEVADTTKTWTYPLGNLSSGSLTLTKAGTTKGAFVEGSFTAEWGGTGSKGGE